MTESIETTIERFLRTGEGNFDDTALRLFAHQFTSNPRYRAYCEALGQSPETVRRWQDIPAVPTTAFKSPELAAFPTNRAAAVFYSSTTTGQKPSQHFMKTLSYYETALKHSFSEWVFPGPRLVDGGLKNATPPFLVLAPTPGEAPRSSLSWMLNVVLRKWGGSGSGHFWNRGRLDVLGLTLALEKAEKSGQPVVLLGTTLAFLAFFEACEKSQRRFRCAPGSRLMDTGGSKSLTKSIDREAFVKQVGERFGIPPELCVNEYGMCELSSQFYGTGKQVRLQAPPWVRTLFIDAETQKEVISGQDGVARHFDLANVDSILAIQTADVGSFEDGGFVLKGRQPGAEIRGCSLQAETSFPAVVSGEPQ